MYDYVCGWHVGGMKESLDLHRESLGETGQARRGRYGKLNDRGVRAAIVTDNAKQCLETVGQTRRCLIDDKEREKTLVVSIYIRIATET
jgi:hypothetical protein